MKKSDNDITRKLDDFEVYLKSEMRSPTTIKTYVPVVKRFLESLDVSDFDEGDVRTFLANQVYDLKGNTARKIHYALAAYFASLKLDFHLKPSDPTDHPYKPTMDLKQMPKIIATIKQSGDATEQGVLALSSTYGVRCSELVIMGRGDIDFDNDTITIRAKKHGRERVHLVPKVIMPYISNYDFKPRSDRTFERIFWQMMEKCRLDLKKGYGLHSIRRALNVGFRARGVDILLRHEFMRWRFRDRSMIDMIYETTSPVEIDKLVFKKHPFLPAWRR